MQSWGEFKLTSGSNPLSKILYQLDVPALDRSLNPHVDLGLSSEASDLLSLDKMLLGRRVDQVGKDSRSVTDRRDNASISPNLCCNVLQALGSWVIDQRSVAGRGEENSVLRRVQFGSLGHVIELLAELAVGVFPGLQVLAVQEVGLLREPIRGVFASLRCEIDFEAGRGQDIVRV